MASSVAPETPEANATTRLERAIAEALDVGVWLDRRRYRRQTAVTFERNVYTARAARDTGLVKALQGFDPLHDEVSERIEGLILDAFTDGSMFRLLAGALSEDGMEWSPATASETVDRFRRLTDPVDQASLYDIASWALLDFFLNAGASWRTFLKYLRLSTRPMVPMAQRATGVDASASVAGDENEKPSSPKKPPTGRDANNEAPGAVIPTSESGTRSSDPSRANSIASR